MKRSLSLFTLIILLSASAYDQIKALKQFTKRVAPEIIHLILALAVVFSAACSKSASTRNSSSSTNTSTGSTASSTSSGGATAGSPTAALRSYYQAAMNKDINSAKKYLSAGTIAMMEEGAKKMGKSLDEAFKESAEQSSTPAIPEFTNEKITGDTATVDMKAQGMSVTMPLVKEGGEWKLAMDKLINDMKNSTGSNGTESAVIDFSGDGKTTSSITFDEAEMRHLESRIEYGDSKAALDYVSRKMELMGLKCCEPRKRIDKCVWQCCDKSTISTCNKTLQAVLEKSEAQ